MSVSIERSDVLVIDNGVEHALGNPDAPVQIVEYGDFTCPICHQAFPLIKSFLTQFDKKIHFAFRHFPVNSLRPLAERASEAAEAAAAQGEFWEFHDFVFTRAPLSSENDLWTYAEQLTLDRDRFSNDMADHIGSDRIRTQMSQGHDLGIRTSPGFFVNGRRVDVSGGFTGLRATVHHALGLSE